MEWQLWLAVPGPLLSRPHTCWLISSGGELTIILCVLTHPYEYRSCSRGSEVASWWRNATGNVPQPWQREEPTDSGQRAKSCAILCRQCHALNFEHEET